MLAVVASMPSAAFAVERSEHQALRDALRNRIEQRIDEIRQRIDLRIAELREQAHSPTTQEHDTANEAKDESDELADNDGAEEESEEEEDREETETDEDTANEDAEESADENTEDQNDVSTSTPEYDESDETENTDQTSDDIAEEVASLVHDLLNEEREEAGLAPVAHDADLADIARAHSADMAAKDYFSHTNQEGCSSSCRLDEASYEYRSMGENIYMMWGFDLGLEETAAKIVDSWMNSPGHRANILTESFTHGGVGIVQVGDHLYATSLFSIPQ